MPEGGRIRFRAGVYEATGQEQEYCFFSFLLVFFFLSFCFFRAAPMEVPRLGAESELWLPGLHHSHSNSGSELRLRPTPQLTATQDQPTEQGQGSNLQPHGS